MIGMLYDKYGYIDKDEFIKLVGLYEYNLQSMGWDLYQKNSKMIVGITSENKSNLILDDDMKNIISDYEFLEVCRLVFNKKYVDLIELDDENEEVDFYG